MYIILQPNSQTNPSDKYRVVFNDDWMRYVNGATRTYAFTAFDTYDEAETVADEANRVLRKPVPPSERIVVTDADRELLR